MSFFVFILLNAVLILRPAEIIEAVRGYPLYNICILVSIVLSLPQLIAQFSPASLKQRPLTVCVIGLQLAVILANVVNFEFDTLFDRANDFSKLLIYYLLLMANVTSAKRLRSLMFWSTIFLGILALLTLLNLYGVISIPELNALDEGEYDKTTGVKSVIMRLQASGIFNNPNAYARVLTVGILLAVYWMTDPKMRLAIPFWIGLIGIFGTAQIETKSRGGFLGLMLGLVVLFISKFGLKRGLPLVLIGAPALLVVVGGRQANMDTEDGTGAHRITLWRLGLDALITSKFRGIGMDMYPTEAHGYVAHNSFVHGYVELGFFGGTLFFSLFYLTISTLWALRKDEDQIEDPLLKRLRPYLLAVIGGEVVGFMSISRNYVMSTYLVVGMCAVYLDLLRQYPGIKIPEMNAKLALRLVKMSALFLTVLYLYVRYKTRYS